METWSSHSQRRRHGTIYFQNFEYPNYLNETKTELKDRKYPKFGVRKFVQRCRPEYFSFCLKKTVKLLGYLFCTVSCVLQVWGFIEMYLEYPSTMDINVEFLNEVYLPAVSICNKNWFKRKALCSKYPELYSEKCKDDRLSLVVSTDTRNKMSMETFHGMGYAKDDLVKGCRVSDTPDEEELTKEVCESNSWHVNNFIKCYMFNTQWNGLKNFTPKASSSFKLTFKLDAQKDSYMQPIENYPPELFLRVHNEYVIPIHGSNEFFRIRPGLTYSIPITKSTINLLEPPFKPGCIDYRKRWRDAKGKGPTSREGCISECRLNISMKNCGCIASDFMFPEGYEKCTGKLQNSCVNMTSPEYSNCETTCLSDCQAFILDQYVSKDFQNNNQDVTPYQNFTFSGYSSVEIFMQSRRHMIYQHKPKITPIEVLGYVGGYLSLWLGLSIPMVYDFLEIIFLYLLQNTRIKNKTSSI